MSTFFIYICTMSHTPILFAPGDEPLKVLYPILKTFEELNRINDAELLFVWYYACKSSPIYGVKESDKPLQAMKLVPDFIKNLKEEDYEKYVNGEFPAYVTEAIRVMKEFIPEIRHKVKTYTDRILAYIDHVTTMDIEKYTEVGDIKSFMDMQMNIGKNLASIVNNAEHGYGFKKSKESSKKISSAILEEE